MPDARKAETATWLSFGITARSHKQDSPGMVHKLRGCEPMNGPQNIVPDAA